MDLHPNYAEEMQVLSQNQEVDKLKLKKTKPLLDKNNIIIFIKSTNH